MSFWTWVAGPVATCADSPHSAMRPSAWTARARSLPSRGPRRIARCCTRTSSRSTCRQPASTGSSRTLRCFTCRVTSSPVSSGSLLRPSNLAALLFCSNPRGRDVEGWVGGRFGCFHDLETWRRYVTAAGFRELHHYYRPPGRPRARQPLARHGLAQEPITADARNRCGIVEGAGRKPGPDVPRSEAAFSRTVRTCRD